MHPPSPAATAMDFSQNSLFGYMEDLQELTIIERPVRRSLKVRPGEEELPAGRPAAGPCPTPARSLHEAARDPLRVLLPAPAPLSPRGPCYPNPTPLGPPSSTRLGFSQPGPPALRYGRPGPARDPSDALAFPVARPGPARPGPFPQPGHLRNGPPSPFDSGQLGVLSRAVPLSRPGAPPPRPPPPGPCGSCPSQPQPAASRVLSLGLPLPPLRLPGAAAARGCGPSASLQLTRPRLSSLPFPEIPQIPLRPPPPPSSSEQAQGPHFTSQPTHTHRGVVLLSVFKALSTLCPDPESPRVPSFQSLQDS